jgi:hypothetical protein
MALIAPADAIVLTYCQVRNARQRVKECEATDECAHRQYLIHVCCRQLPCLSPNGGLLLRLAIKRVGRLEPSPLGPRSELVPPLHECGASA